MRASSAGPRRPCQPGMKLLPRSRPLTKSPGDASLAHAACNTFPIRLHNGPLYLRAQRPSPMISDLNKRQALSLRTPRTIQEVSAALYSIPCMKCLTKSFDQRPSSSAVQDPRLSTLRTAGRPARRSPGSAARLPGKAGPVQDGCKAASWECHAAATWRPRVLMQLGPSPAYKPVITWLTLFGGLISLEPFRGNFVRFHTKAPVEPRRNGLELCVQPVCFTNNFVISCPEQLSFALSKTFSCSCPVLMIGLQTD